MLLDFVNKRVGVITNDGRMLVGNMLGYDQVCNIVLDKCVERVFEPNQPMQTISSDSLNTFIIRGDDIAVIGEIDSEKDDKESWTGKTVCDILDMQRHFSEILPNITNHALF